MKKVCLIGLPVMCLLLISNALASRAWSPQPYEVKRDRLWMGGLGFKEVIELSTPYYTIVHDLESGGVISQIKLTHGQAENLLVSPLECSVQLASAAGSRSSEQRARTARIYSDTGDRSPEVTVSKSGDWEVITVEASLLNEQGEESGVRTKTTYTYRWGYIKVHKEIIIEANEVLARTLSVLSTILDPSLSWYGYRPGIRELMDPNLFTWRNGQIRQWGPGKPVV